MFHKEARGLMCQVVLLPKNCSALLPHCSPGHDNAGCRGPAPSPPLAHARAGKILFSLQVPVPRGKTGAELVFNTLHPADSCICSTAQLTCPSSQGRDGLLSSGSLLCPNVESAMCHIPLSLPMGRWGDSSRHICRFKSHSLTGQKQRVQTSPKLVVFLGALIEWACFKGALVLSSMCKTMPGKPLSRAAAAVCPGPPQRPFPTPGLVSAGRTRPPTLYLPRIAFVWFQF